MLPACDLAGWLQRGDFAPVGQRAPEGSVEVVKFGSITENEGHASIWSAKSGSPFGGFGVCRKGEGRWRSTVFY